MALTIRSTYSVSGRSCSAGTTRAGVIQLRKRLNADNLDSCSYLRKGFSDTQRLKVWTQMLTVAVCYLTSGV